jgi:hypothetical protein
VVKTTFGHTGGQGTDTPYFPKLPEKSVSGINHPFLPAQKVCEKNHNLS